MTEGQPTSRVGRVRARAGARLRAARARWAWFDHAVRAYNRNNTALGSQLAAAITFFGFLSFFPLVALAFAVVGYVSGAYPDAQDTVTRSLQGTFPSLIGTGPGRINIDQVIAAKKGAGIVGLLGLLYSGLGWLDALRDALRRVFGTSDVSLSFLKKKLTDILVLAGLGLALLASLVVTSFATAATTQVLGLVSLDESTVAVTLLKVLAVALGVLADTALFAILLSRMSGAHLPWRRVRSAAVLGAVGFELLKLVGTFLIGRTTHNPVYATFGVVVGLLIWINLVSQLLMFAAAWCATQPPADESSAPAEVASAAAPVVGVRRRRWRPVLLGAVVGAGLAAALRRRKDRE
jgi:membrane protein